MAKTIRAVLNKKTFLGIPIRFSESSKELLDYEVQLEQSNDSSTWEEVLDLANLRVTEGLVPELRGNAINSTVEYKNASGNWVFLFSYESLKGNSGKEIELSSNATHILYRYVGDVSWTNLILLSDLKGTKGDEIELKASNTHIQYKTTSSANWVNLITLSELKGPSGKNVEFSVDSNKLLYRLVGDSLWVELYDFSTLPLPSLVAPVLFVVGTTLKFKLENQIDEDAIDLLDFSTLTLISADSIFALFGQEAQSGNVKVVLENGYLKFKFEAEALSSLFLQGLSSDVNTVAANEKVVVALTQAAKTRIINECLQQITPEVLATYFKESQVSIVNNKLQFATQNAIPSCVIGFVSNDEPAIIKLYFNPAMDITSGTLSDFTLDLPDAVLLDLSWISDTVLELTVSRNLVTSDIFNLSYVGISNILKSENDVEISNFDISVFNFVVISEDTTAPGIPQNITVESTTINSVVLAWDDVTDIDLVGYHIYQDGALITPQAITEATFEITGLSANTEYDFVITSVDAANNESGNSSTITVTTASIYPIPEAKIVGLYRYDNINADGSSWLDAGPNNYHLLQSNVNKRPNIEADAAVFDGFDDGYELTGLNLNLDTVCFYVFCENMPVESNRYAFIGALYGTGVSTKMYYQSNSLSVNKADGTVKFSERSTAQGLTKKRGLTTPTYTSVLEVNGVEDSDVQTITSSVYNTITIGYEKTGSNYYNFFRGKIVGVVITKSVLSVQEQADIYTWLSQGQANASYTGNAIKLQSIHNLATDAPEIYIKPYNNTTVKVDKFNPHNYSVQYESFNNTSNDTIYLAADFYFPIVADTDFSKGAIWGAQNEEIVIIQKHGGTNATLANRSPVISLNFEFDGTNSHLLLLRRWGDPGSIQSSSTRILTPFPYGRWIRLILEDKRGKVGDASVGVRIWMQDNIHLGYTTPVLLYTDTNPTRYNDNVDFGNFYAIGIYEWMDRADATTQRNALAALGITTRYFYLKSLSFDHEIYNKSVSEGNLLSILGKVSTRPYKALVEVDYNSLTDADSVANADGTLIIKYPSVATGTDVLERINAGAKGVYLSLNQPLS